MCYEWSAGVLQVFGGGHFFKKAIAGYEPLAKSVVCALAIVKKLTVCFNNFSILSECSEMKEVENC